jgi:hypothetical protein
MEHHNELVKLHDTMLLDITHIPSWVNAKKPTHKTIWDLTINVISIISKCSVSRVLSERTIARYHHEINELIIDIVMLADEEEIELEASHFITNAFNKYINEAEVLELYEVAANIMALKNKYMTNA